MLLTGYFLRSSRVNHRISKYCSFSKFPIPDGCPFYYSKNLKKSNNNHFFALPSTLGFGQRDKLRR